MTWSFGERVGEVRAAAAAMAAERKEPEARRTGRGVVSDNGWFEGVRKGGGTSRWVRGW